MNPPKVKGKKKKEIPRRRKIENVCFIEKGPRSRTEMFKMAKAAGHNPSAKISPNTTLLVHANNGDNFAVMRIEARSKMIKTITYYEFMEQYL